MKKEFWLERWETRQTGFHQAEVNPYLQKFWSALKCPSGAAVFVPLCGKSRDMIWLEGRGHSVLGVELSPLAVKEFFEENGADVQPQKQGAFDVSAHGGIRILCGDFFDLTREDLQTVKAVYDRAALIALPPEMRKKYAAHLMRILPPGAKILLVTIDYPEGQMEGPPFSVPPSEVEALFADVQLLERRDVLAENARFQERGLNRLHENVFEIRVNS